MIDHLFVSDSDGSLYDTRRPQWHTLPPLRAVYRRTFSRIDNTAELRATLRNGAFTGLGGYPLYFIANDGESLSFESVRANLSQCVYSIRHQINDGWRIIGCTINYEDSEMVCAHSGKPIASAYGE